MIRKAIAIDFDGCLCTDAFPDIGEPNWPVIYKAKAEQRAGAGLILWTCREDQLLLDALSACESWGLTFDAVNESLPDWIEAFKTKPRKVGATEYWDDKAVNPITLNGTYVNAEWFNQVNAELQAYKKAKAEESKPLTQEQLWYMSGEPIWITGEQFHPRWDLIRRVTTSGMSTYTLGFLSWEDCLKTWFARRRPEEVI